MLRNPTNDKYIDLGEEELFLWNRMDGMHTVRDLALAYVSKYTIPGHTVLFNLLDLLTSNAFLKGKPDQPASSVVTHLPKRRTLTFLTGVAHFLAHGTLTLKNIDKYFDWLYRHTPHFLYTRSGTIVFTFFILADITFFIYFHFIQHVDLLISPIGVHVVDIVSLMVILFLSIVIHEFAHCMAVKAYGRKVLRGGLMLYFGVPTAFGDTTDIWMKPRRARIVVSLAGPFANAVIGGLLFLIAAFLSDSTLRDILLHGGIINSIIFFFNLVPIAETDGHYIIQDFLEIPRLRSKALHFIGHDMWSKSARRESWSREDFIFLIYGLVTAAGTAFLVYVAIHLWISTGITFVEELISRPWLVLEIFSVLVVIAAISAVLYSILRRHRQIAVERR